MSFLFGRESHLGDATPVGAPLPSGPTHDDAWNDDDFDTMRPHTAGLELLDLIVALQPCCRVTTRRDACTLAYWTSDGGRVRSREHTEEAS